MLAAQQLGGRAAEEVVQVLHVAQQHALRVVVAGSVHRLRQINDHREVHAIGVAQADRQPAAGLDRVAALVVAEQDVETEVAAQGELNAEGKRRVTRIEKMFNAKAAAAAKKEDEDVRS